MDENPVPLVLASGLCRFYGRKGVELKALDHVDLTVNRGDFVLLKGRSGSGKTTLLSLLAGLDRPDAGSLRVGDYDLSPGASPDLDTFRRHGVGVIFQSFNLLPTLRAVENVMLPLLLAGGRQQVAQKRAGDLLGSLGMGPRMHHLPAELSGGEMQRVAIARALVNEPMLLLADEPTGNLDENNAMAVIDLLADLVKNGATLVMATHSDMADPFASHIIHLMDGRVSAPRPDPSGPEASSVKKAALATDFPSHPIQGKNP
ncbi:putative ABC transport system ATP-binding protein [Desulfobotulus alkaliphilus]|uniref:Putative ABC transport system ATP-binding protein n=1 Tax=Desulfobotulus alkaliphilus TaxID=622671 RepID=A0A562RW06_9BACT|nr:ABC transporter ATP-binding protein [Desulfobotulus alkaliphilus]TWI73297.1 putative ABC transport system ATP-binding protein [Desulfobotulus alkaliphilus]